MILFCPFLPGTRSKPHLLWQNTLLLKTLLKEECKKVSLEKPPSHTTAAHGLFASPVIWGHRERPEGGPHHPFHCTAAHCRGTMLHQSCLHLAYGTMGADLAFLVACWFCYSEPEKRRGTRVVSPRGRKVWGSKPLPVALWERKQAWRVEGGAGGWQRRGLGDSSEAEPAWSSWVPFLLSSSLALEGSRAPFYSHTLETHMCACVCSMWCVYALPLAWAKTMSFWFSNVLNQMKSEQVSVLKGKKERDHKKT